MPLDAANIGRSKPLCGPPRARLLSVDEENRKFSARLPPGWPTGIFGGIRSSTDTYAWFPEAGPKFITRDAVKFVARGAS